MDTRLLAYIALIFLGLLIYDAWMEDYGPEPVPPAEVNTETQVRQQDIPELSQEPQTTKTDTRQADMPLPGVSPVTASSALSSGQTIKVQTDILSLEIDLQGGTVVQADLLNYPVDVEHPDQPVRLLAVNDRFYVAQSGLLATKRGRAPDHYAGYQAERRQYSLEDGEDELIIPLVWKDASGITVTKTFKLKRNSYAINVEHRVDNGSGQPWQGRQYRQLQRNYLKKGGNRFVHTYTGAVIYSPENKYEKIDFEKIAENPLQRGFESGWAAMIEHYFLSAWVPPPSVENTYYTRAVDTQSGIRYLIGLTSPAQTAAPGESLTFSSLLYVGPKEHERLEKIAPGLELAVDYGYITVIAQPVFWLLDKIHSLVGNWGWAIVLVTLLIKLAFYKLAETSYRSMAKMRQVQPKMMAIRERYANDRQRQSQAMMELYKKEKINPLGGCLPMVIQIPVFIALYWVLLESVELRQAPFILWIKDLSVKDPYFVLPVIMGISMYFQQKLNPAPLDPVQAKVFAVLPFVFTVFFAFFPAGLVLYWVVNNTLTIAQQWFITNKVLKNK
jgi:YidC/Oxa1 family membrane protein insertase